MEWVMELPRFLQLTQDMAHQAPLFLPSKLEATEEVYLYLISRKQINQAMEHQLRKTPSMILMTCLELAVKLLSFTKIFLLIDLCNSSANAPASKPVKPA